MKRSVMPVLVGVNIALAAVLAWMWVGADGKLRNTAWTPPQQIRPDFSTPLAGLVQRRTDEAAQLVLISERPLFSPNRRPPPPPPPPAAPDPLANLQLLGVYTGTGGGGIIARVDGKVRRAALNEKIGAWTVQKIQDRDVTFVRGTESRVLQLTRSKAAPSAPPTSGLPVGAGTAGTPAPAGTPMTGAQRAEEEERARLRYINELNIRNGLPPVTHR